MDFEWNSDKATLNLRKHGVRFTIAVRAFFDPYRVEMYDGREDYGEDRWATVGFAEDGTRKPSDSFQREKPMTKNASNTVKLTLDPDKLPPLTEEERAELRALAAMPDDRIDYSDAPSRPDAVWARAVDFPRAKKQITLRIDEDVLTFFRNTGSRYQTRINAVLRSYVEAHRNMKAA